MGDGFDQNMSLIDLSDAILVSAVGAGWAETTDENGHTPEGAPERIFMLTIDHYLAEEIEKGESEVHQMFLAFSPESMDDLILTMARVLMGGADEGERGEKYE